jgi:hypothetical protein
MKRLVLALLLLALLLSFTLSVALAGVPDYEDPTPPGAAHANSHANVHTLCVKVPAHAADNAHFLQCPE